MNKKYDAIIIGAGQAGPALAVKLAKNGMKVAICERKFFGGTCINNGCIPSKTLIASAYAAHFAQHVNKFGIEIDGCVNVNMEKVKERKEKIVHRLRKSVEDWLRNTKHCDVYHGHARFQDKNTIKVDEEILHADKIFINVGARAAIPPISGIKDVNYLTNSTIMDLDIIPEHLLIIGGSYIGLEFAQMFRRFGSRVTIIEQAPRLIPREDEDISDAIKEVLQNENITLHLSTQCMAVEKAGENIKVNLGCDENEFVVEGSHLLLATGRQPNTDDLGLEKIDLQLDKKGYIVVDDQLHTSVENIFALGECNGKGAFTHTAYNDYQIVADNLLANKSRSIKDRITAYNLYIDPPLGRVGLSEAEVRKLGRSILVGKKPMSEIKRAIIKEQTQGFMKVLIDADTKKILGASMLGVDADEIIHIFLDMMYADAEYTVLQNAVHIHPTVSELIPTMLENLKLLT